MSVSQPKPYPLRLITHDTVENVKIIPALAITALLAFGLSGCDPVTESPDTSTGGDSDVAETDDGGFAGVTLPGTGDYLIPDDAPIGGFEWPDVDSQPDGCTWTLYHDESVRAENQGNLVFFTDATTRFVTDGCPDWVQFE